MERLLENVPLLLLVAVPTDAVSKVSAIVSLAPKPLPFTVIFVVGGAEERESLSAALVACTASLLLPNSASSTVKTMRNESRLRIQKRPRRCIQAPYFQTKPSSITVQKCEHVMGNLALSVKEEMQHLLFDML
jgi:hypothetical protein